MRRHRGLLAALLSVTLLSVDPALAQDTTATESAAEAMPDEGGVDEATGAAGEAMAAGGEAPPEEGLLEKMIVTARKREERLQDIPLSITAISGVDLEQQRIDDALDLQFRVPNLFFSTRNFTLTNLQIRGIGSQVVAASGEQAVGIHVNTVPMTTSRIFEQEFFDVERVEVLRGPQGTLFGRNSTGGSFNIYTRKPTDQYEANGEFLVGNFDAFRFRGAVNIPVGDRVRTRFAAMYHNRDGFIENLGTGDRIDDRELFGVRGSFQVDFTEDLQMDLMASYFREDDQRSPIGKQLCTKDPLPTPFSLGCSDTPMDSRPGFGTVTSHGTIGGILESYGIASAAMEPGLGFLTPLIPIGADANADAVNPPGLRVQNARIDPSYLADELFFTLDLHQDFDKLTLAWVSGYQSTLVDSRQDYNMTQPSLAWDPAAVTALGLLPTIEEVDGQLNLGRFGFVNESGAEDHSRAESEQISTELRAVSSFDGALNFTAGVSYVYFVMRADYQVFHTAAEVLGRIAVLGNPAYDPTLFHFNIETKPARTNSFGLFGEGYWDITDALKFTLGLRYTWDRKTARSRNSLLDSSGVLPEFINQEAEWHEPTGRASLDYRFDTDWSDESMVFVSGARGYKPGGFNSPAVTIFPDVADTFDPEGLWAFEVGTKNQFLDRRLTVNLTGFFYDYQDYQVSKIVARTSVNENVNAYLWGLEAEFFANPVENLLVNFSLAYLSSSIRDTTSIDPANLTAGDPMWTPVKVLSDASNTITSNPLDPTNPAFWHPDGGIEQDLDGNELPNIPEIQINVGGEYTFAAPWDGDFTARISYYWQSDMYGRIFNSNRDKIDSWSQADAVLRWVNSTNNVWIDLWVKNFTDNDDITTHYLTDASSGNFTNVFLLDPRTWGITVGVNWP